MKYIAILLLLTTTVQAWEVKFYKKGEVVEYDGYLFEPKAEKELRLLDTELTYNKKLVTSLLDINKAYENEVSVMQARISNQTKELSEARSEGFFSRPIMFILGIATSILTLYAMKKVQ